MANSKEHESNFYAYNMVKLIESTKRRKELEANFDKSKRFVYDEICDNQISYAVELIKIGVDSELKDGKVSILADNGDIIEFSKEEISEKVGDNVFSIMFPKEKASEEEEDPEFLDDELKIEDKSTDYWGKDNVVSPQEIYPSFNDLQRNMLMNSMSLLFPMQMMQAMQPPMQPSVQSSQRQPTGYKRPGNGGDPLQAIQYQMEELRASRDKMKEKAVHYKKEYQEYKTKYEDAAKENEELDKVAVEQINEIKKEKQNLSDEIVQLKESISSKETELKNCEETINSLKINLSNKEHESKEYKEKVQDTIKTLESRFNSIQNKVNLKEEEFKSKTAELENKNRELSEKERELEESSMKLKETEEQLNASREKIEEYERTEQRLSEQIHTLEIANEELKKQLEDSHNKINLANKDKESLKQQISDISSSQDDDKKKYESLRIENDSLKNKSRGLQNENNTLKDENNSLKSREKELQNEKSTLKSETDSLKSKEKELQNENNSLKNKNSDLDKKCSALNKKCSELENSNSKAKEQLEEQKEMIKNLKEELSVLKEVAYKDTKFEINSKAGFNKVYHDKKKHVQIVALVDVCSMKGINDEFGEDTGNKVIQLTIDELVNAFGKDNVYRIRGAQFGIIIENGSYSKVVETLENIKKSLNNVQEFDIVYGVVSINKCSGRGEALTKARSEMQQMKKERDAALNIGGNIQENSYTPVPMDNPVNQANYQYPSNDNQMSQNQMGYANPTNGYQTPTDQEPVPGNPNVAVEMMTDDDPYGDDTTAKEVDATSIDLAREIMEMSNM